MHNKGRSRFFVESLFFSQYQKTSYRNPSVFQKFSGTEKVSV